MLNAEQTSPHSIDSLNISCFGRYSTSNGILSNDPVQVRFDAYLGVSFRRIIQNPEYIVNVFHILDHVQMKKNCMQI